jgi:hypothetical protein
VKYPYPKQNKNENYEYGFKILSQFCQYNGIPVPNIKNTKSKNLYGYYKWGSSTIWLNITRCRTPVNVPGYTWSYTGYKSDLTVAGVLAHECGHYIDDRLNKPSKQISRFVKGEKSVTSYEPDNYEVFAESMKLFILNPDLLRHGRPKRYEYITSLGLKPLILDSWDVVLTYAHPKLIASAKNWMCK